VDTLGRGKFGPGGGDGAWRQAPAALL